MFSGSSFPLKLLVAFHVVVLVEDSVDSSMWVIWPIVGFFKEKSPAPCETQTRDSELVCPHASH